LFLVQIGRNPIFETLLQLFASVWCLVFFGKVDTFAHLLVGTDLSLVHQVTYVHCLTLAKGRYLKASTNDTHFLGGLQVRPQPEKEQALLSWKKKQKT
jgi:hypothetical protein